jgi:hypothetical protein
VRKPDDWSMGSWLLLNFAGWIILLVVAKGLFMLFSRW